MKKKTIALFLALALVVGCAIGGTVAWLTASTTPVVNTFTVGDINITLTETFNTDTNNDGTNDKWTGKIVPGTNLSKDPKVTVKANSEACWLFVKVEEANWPTATETGGTTRKVNYAIAAGWTQGTGNVTGGNGVPTNVCFREVSASAADQAFGVLANDQVTVSGTLTKTEVDAITTSPTLTFTAYAIQKDSFATAALAWAEVSK